LDPSIPIRVDTLERFRKCLDGHTGSDEAVKGYPWGRGAGHTGRGEGGILGGDEADKLRREVVPELAESISQFLTFDGTRVIRVEMAKDILPVCDVLPESSKLVKVDRATVVYVKNSHQHLGRVQIKGTPVSVDERPL